jgi:hypothetical protein
MADLDTLIARRNDLEEAVARKTQTVEIDGKRITYRSVAELELALARVTRQIAAIQGRRVSQIVITSTKGL